MKNQNLKKKKKIHHLILWQKLQRQVASFIVSQGVESASKQTLRAETATMEHSVELWLHLGLIMYNVSTLVQIILSTERQSKANQKHDPTLTGNIVCMIGQYIKKRLDTSQ